MEGIDDAKDREDICAYLKTQHSSYLSSWGDHVKGEAAFVKGISSGKTGYKDHDPFNDASWWETFGWEDSKNHPGGKLKTHKPDCDENARRECAMLQILDCLKGKFDCEFNF
jgi:hypothetical protein